MLSDSQKLDLILESLAGVNTRLDRVDQRMGGIEQRFEGLEQRMDGFEQRIGGLEQRIDGLQQRIGGLEQRIDGLEQRIGGLEQRMDGFEQRIAKLERRIDGFGERMDIFEAAVDARMTQFERRLDGFELRMDGFQKRLENFEEKLTNAIKDVRHETAQGFVTTRGHLGADINLLRKDFTTESLAARKQAQEHFEHFTATIFNLGELLSRKMTEQEQRYMDYWSQSSIALDFAAKQYEKFFDEKLALRATDDRQERMLVTLQESDKSQTGALQDLRMRVRTLEEARAQ